VKLDIIVKLVLGICKYVGFWLTTPFTYIVPISAAHLETSISFLVAGGGIAVTDNVLKTMTTCPVLRPYTSISLHGVRLAEIVP
jgi:hypothetical protein